MKMITLDKQYSTWNLQRISRHVVYWGVWLLFYGVVNGTFYEGLYSEWFLYEILFMAVKIPYSYLVAYYLFPLCLPERKYLKLGILVVIFAFLGMILIYFLKEYFPLKMTAKPQEFWTSSTIYMFIDLIYVASPVVAIKLIQQNIAQIRANEQLKVEKTQAELQNLKNQLQPHFLFNTLNNIYGMVMTKDLVASGAILKLSEILSYILYECNANWVDIIKEVEILKNYIDLEKLRYGEKLDLFFDHQEIVKGKAIPPLLLMPFIENAFKHGPSAELRQSWIRIHLQVVEQKLDFIIENSTTQAAPSANNLQSGIGLKNVAKRLEYLYPNKHHLVINNGETFLVRLQIDL